MRTLRITPIDFSQTSLYSALKNPIARIMDEARIVGGAEQTVSMLSDATKLDYETVQSALQHLTRLGLAHPTRMVGNAQAYKFNIENNPNSLLGLTGQLQDGKRRPR
jgi:hypothetical protein